MLFIDSTKGRAVCFTFLAERCHCTPLSPSTRTYKTFLISLYHFMEYNVAALPNVPLFCATPHPPAQFSFMLITKMATQKCRTNFIHTNELN